MKFLDGFFGIFPILVNQKCKSWWISKVTEILNEPIYSIFNLKIMSFYFILQNLTPKNYLEKIENVKSIVISLMDHVVIWL